MQLSCSLLSFIYIHFRVLYVLGVVTVFVWSGVELRALHLRGRYTFHLNLAPSPFSLFSRVFLGYVPPNSASYTTGITGIQLHMWLIDWDRISLTLLGWPQTIILPTPKLELQAWTTESSLHFRLLKVLLGMIVHYYSLNDLGICNRKIAWFWDSEAILGNIVRPLLGFKGRRVFLMTCT
jgi:hypothetical protein